MDTDAIDAPEFWGSEAPLVLAPSHLRAEGEVVQKLLANGGYEWAVGGVVFASSGSTGPPKWILHTRQTLLASAQMVNRHLEVRENDRWFLALPLVHVGGVGVVARAHQGQVEISGLEGRWDAESFATALQDTTATLTSLVPTQVHDLVKVNVSAPPSLRAVVVGGGALVESLGAEARSLGWPVLQSYGMTETGSQVATAALENLRAKFQNSPLEPLPGWECRANSSGILEVRGAALFQGYLHLENGALHLNDPREDGWFASNDMVEISEGGLRFKGRADRRVKIRGELVDLDALEQSLQDGLGCDASCCLVALVDERVGHRLVPVVSSSEHSGVQELVGNINAALPAFSRLEKPEFLDALPLSPLGKVDLSAVKELLRVSATSRLPKL